MNVIKIDKNKSPQVGAYIEYKRSEIYCCYEGDNERITERLNDCLVNSLESCSELTGKYKFLYLLTLSGFTSSLL